MVNVYQVLIYYPRENEGGVVEAEVLDCKGSRAEQAEIKGSKSVAWEESTNVKQWRGKRVRSEGSDECSNPERHQNKRSSPEEKNWRKRSVPSS
ncbi:hypothetical protein TNCT_145641 [Trichonephila clavata]|uniref:Uncharacterized protein n=1 Tax=Trichonephila clavata TaxID=2740835 RepID=A0A8X6GSL0_TRICU|nr:hypothetical protein TNCT_145641 [Trichonephila clavata]